MKDKSDKLVIELYGGGQFQGYLKHLSIANRHFDSTPYKQEAKAYAKVATANKDIEAVAILTNGAIRGVVG